MFWINYSTSRINNDFFSFLTVSALQKLQKDRRKWESKWDGMKEREERERERETAIQRKQSYIHIYHSHHHKGRADVWNNLSSQVLSNLMPGAESVAAQLELVFLNVLWQRWIHLHRDVICSQDVWEYPVLSPLIALSSGPPMFKNTSSELR